MTTEHTSAFSRRNSPEVWPARSALRIQRAQGMPGAWCARSRVCNGRKVKAHALVRSHRKHPAFPAQWFYGFLRALPGDRLFCHRHPRSFLRELDASVEASGPHDFAVRSCTIRQRRYQRPPHPAPTSVTIAKRPSVGRDVHGYRPICDFGKSEYFCWRDWTCENS
jgi:hypothetical protein